MSNDVEINYLLTVSAEDAMTELRKVERLLFRTLSLFERMGLSPDVQQAINQLQRLIMTVRSVQVAINLMYAASGPVGWALAAVGLGTAVFMTADFAESLNYDFSRGHD